MFMQGYELFEGALFLDDKTKKNIAASRFIDIFNKKVSHQVVYSNQRQQSTSNRSWNTAVTRRLRDVLCNLGVLDPEHHTITKVVGLRSNGVCEKQVEHCDSAPEGFFDKSPVFPMACIVAIQDGTKLYIRSRNTGRESCVHMREGDLLIFRGDVKHAGAEYTTTNLRLHCYIDTNTYTRPKDTTFL